MKKSYVVYIVYYIYSIAFKITKMNLPNSSFNDFPIEFKEINPSDFPEFEVENNNEKIIIEPDSNGYINEAFQGHINLLHKNTVVVNAAVGQGKSTAIIKTIKRYYENHPDTIIFVASPFVTLVDQYCNDIHSKASIPEDDIFNYNLIGRSLIDFRLRRVQVITVNTLLGNPGEDSFINGKNKRIYLNSLLEHCYRNRLKVVFIYDEIHDAIANFKEEYVFSLWKWRNVILKNYILSATYSEASKIVIEYLAELTDKKIQIIESKRIIFPEKQSTLHLHYSPAYSFKSNNPELFKLIKRLIQTDKQIDILSFSKKLVKDIIEDDFEGVGSLLKENFDLNDCTSELKNNQRLEDTTPVNRYDSSKCNIGTNFKTGVSIEKENHAFIIIMPSRSTRMEFKNQYGIFSGGINSVIQALARQRKKGEIHILLPNPDAFNYSSLNIAGLNQSQIEAFTEFYDLVGNSSTNGDNSIVDYIKLENQDELLTRFYYEELRNNVLEEINFIRSSDRALLPPLRYPDYKLFKLTSGEKYLANKFQFFGEDISAYVTYCAITNQFINCRLNEVTYKPILIFEEDKFQIKFWYYFNTYFQECNILKNHFNFNHFYYLVRFKLFNSFSLKLKNSDNTYSNIYQHNKQFETQLLRFCGFKYFGNRYHYFLNSSDRKTDTEYSRGNYFLDCISIANSVNLDEVTFLPEQKNKIKAYQNLNTIRNLLITKIRTYSGRNREYDFLPSKPTENLFSVDEKNMIISSIPLIIESDSLIKNDVFNFRRNFIDASEHEKTDEKKIQSFYKMLIEDFFKTSQAETRQRLENEVLRVKPILEILQLPNHKIVTDTLRLDPLIEFARENYGSFENYQKILNESLAQT